MDYAIIQTGGKQYKVSPGDAIDVEKLPVEEGSQVELDQVMMVSRQGEVSLGTPTVEGARVVAEVTSHGRGKKLIVLKYKAKGRYRRKQGHRQSFTQLTIKDILVGEAKAPSRRRRTSKAQEGQE